MLVPNGREIKDTIQIAENFNIQEPMIVATITKFST